MDDSPGGGGGDDDDAPLPSPTPTPPSQHSPTLGPAGPPATSPFPLDGSLLLPTSAATSGGGSEPCPGLGRAKPPNRCPTISVRV